MRSSSAFAGLLSLALLGACGGSAAPARPNVILVTLDTLRADHLSCYAEGRARTPAFDRLATEGVRFAAALSASAVTPVSHATILTGQYPYTHGLRVMHAESGYRLPEACFYLPAALADAGYATAAVQSAFPVSGFFAFDRAFDEFHGFDGALETNTREGTTSWRMEELQRRSDETTDLAIDVVDGLAEPFFLWVHYWDPHDDLRVPPDDFVRASGLDPRHLGEREDDTYAVEVAFLDREFGRFLDHLRATERYDDALLLVVADHGEGLDDGLARHGWRGHRMVYQEQIHVPLILRLPRALAADTAGRVVDALVRTADVAPTVLDYLDLPSSARFDGRSLRALVEGSADEPRSAYAEQINGYDRNAHMVEKRPDAAFLYTVTDGEWKLTWRPNMPRAGELFHLATDPKERTNVYADEPAQVERLLVDLARRAPWVTEPFPPAGGSEDERAEAALALGALGYAASTLSDADFAWMCPKHVDLRLPSATRCPHCNELLVPLQLEH